MAFVQPKADGVYYNRISPTPVVFGGSISYPTAMIGTGSRGKLNYLYPVTTTSDLYKAIGNPTENPNDLATYGTLYIEACNAMGKDARLFVIRVDDGTSTAVTISVKDTNTQSPGDVFKVVGAYNGTGLVGGTVQNTLVPGYPNGQNIYNVTFKTPDGAVETYPNIVAYTGSSPAYSATTYLANLMAAVNGISKNWTVVAPTTQSTTAPATVLFTAVGGSDGASVSTSALIGQDGDVNRTGMYAARNSKCAQFVIAGLTDLTVGPTMAAFASSENTLAIGPSFPFGTDTATAITAKQTNNITSPFSVCVLDWLEWYDQKRDKLRFVSPSAAAAGIIASRNPEESPANQPENGSEFIRRTERGTSPRGGTEADKATQAGITWFGPLARNRTFLGLVNGQNACSTLGQDSIYFTRTTNILAQELPDVFGYLIGQLQGHKPDDEVRRSARKSGTSYLRGKNFDAYQIKCDLDNNSFDSINSGIVVIEIWVRTKSAVRYIALNVSAGNGVEIAKSNISQFSVAA